MAEDDLGGGLTGHCSDQRCEVRFPHGLSGVRFERVDGTDGPYARAVLWYAGGRVTADVSIQPAAMVGEVDQTAAEFGTDPGGWRVRVLRLLKGWDPSLDWLGNEPGCLLAAVGATTHPLLGEAYRRGHTALDEIPRWASPVLRCHTPATAATTLDPASTRRVARSLVASLVRHEPPAHIDLRPLGVAVMGVGVLGPDQLANVLDAEHAGLPDGVPLPDPDQVKVVRRMLTMYPSDRAAALLIDAAARHSTAALADWMRQLWWVHERAPRPLPTRLDAVQELCRHLVPVLAPLDAPVAALLTSTPAAPVPDVTMPPALPATPPVGGVLRARRPTRYDEPRMAPEVAEATGVGRWRIPMRLRSVNDFERDGIRYVIPTSRTELERWGAVLHTCVGEYADPMIRGASWIIGLEQHRRLVGCVEVSPRRRTVRQALGPRNQPLPPAMLHSVLRTLEILGVIAPEPT